MVSRELRITETTRDIQLSATGIMLSALQRSD